MDQQQKEKQPPEQALRREYLSPRLIEFGHIHTLTKGTGSMNIDAVSGRRKN